MDNSLNLSKLNIRNCSYCEDDIKVYAQLAQNTSCCGSSDCSCGDSCSCSDDNCTCESQALIIDPIIFKGVNEHSQAVPSFLAITGGKLDFSKVKGIEYAPGYVISGEAQNDIDKIMGEVDVISNIVNTDSSKEYSLDNISTNYVGKIIKFEKFVTSTNSENNTNSSTSINLSSKTNANKLYASLQYSNRDNQPLQKTILEGSIEKLVNWLDDYINNYDEKVAAGKAGGESEVKLSFLLRLRKAIENCDFPIGFGNDEYFESEESDEYVILGAYSADTNTGTAGYLNSKDSADNNNGVSKHTDRSIILNAGLFVNARKYKTETALRGAINSGAFDYINGLTEDEQANALTDVLGAVFMSSDEVYYNYVETYIASVLAHELIHSTHITNEAVTYNTCELIEDDFRNQVVFDGWSESTQTAFDKLQIEKTDGSKFILNKLTYGDLFIPCGNGIGIGFHDLLAYDKTSADKDNVWQHGHTSNTDYEDYTKYSTGTTAEDDKNELLNFVV